jgi:hypothetical protein
MVTTSTLRACAAGTLLLLGACGPAARDGQRPPESPLPAGSEAAEEEPSSDLHATDGDEHHDRVGGDGRHDAPRPVARGPEGPAPVWLSAPMPVYQSGAVLKHMKACGETFLYVDVAKTVGNEAASLRKLVESMSQFGGDKIKRALEAADKKFADAGVDPVASVKEVGFCEDGSNEVLVVGIAPANPVEVPVLLQSFLAAIGEGDGTVQRRGEISQLFDSRGGIAQVGPSIVLAGDEKDVLAAVEPGAPDAKFKDASKHVLQFAEDDVKATIDEKGGTFSLRLEGPARSKTATDIDKKLKALADQLSKTQLKVLGERVRAAKVTQSGKSIIITGTISQTQIGTLLRTAAGMSLKELESVFDDAGSAPPPPPNN